MNDSAAARYYAGLIRDHYVREIEREVRAAHADALLSDERLGELIRAELDARGLTIENLMNNRAIIVRDPDVMSGAPCFACTRVPVAVLFENLEEDLPLDEILDLYPTIKRDQAVQVLRLALQLVETFSGETPEEARTDTRKHRPPDY